MSILPIWTTIDGFSSGVWTCLFNEPSVGITSPTFENNNFNFTVNPNPANIVAVLSFSNEVENTKGVIMDVSGRILSTFHVNHESNKVLDIHDLSSGIYFIKSGNITRKLIIEK